MPITMKDVAKKAGVSLGTVSNYVNGKQTIKDFNKERIEKAIHDLGYEVNVVARNLKMKNSKIIGIVIPSFGNVFAVRTISYLERYFKESGYGLHVSSYDRNPEYMEDLIVELIGMKVDGLILMPSVSLGENEVHRINAIIDKKIPIVVFDSTGDGVRCDHVVLNNYSAFKEATKYLIKKGHKDIGLIVGPENVYSTHERLNGFTQAMAEMGIPVNEDLIRYTDYSKRDSKVKSLELVSSQPQISVVLSAGYRITLGTLAAYNEKHIQVPLQISLLGFDINDIANVLPYSLTGISIPIKDVAAKIVASILNRIHHGFEAPPIIKVVELKFIEGQSVQQN